MRVDQQRWLEAEIDRLAGLEAIVRDLAAEDPCDDDDYRCALCSEIHGDHTDNCAWLRATQFVSAAPVEDAR